MILFLESVQTTALHGLNYATNGMAGRFDNSLDFTSAIIEIDDFKIVHSHNALHVLNAPSPAATAGLAIGKAVNDMAEKHFKL